MISIVLPIGLNENREKIKRCLDALNQQTYKKLEVIVVTFPSVTQKFLKLFKKYPLVKIISGDWNKSAARNIGAEKAKQGLPQPIKADGATLPFKNNQFKTVFALRVISHLPFPKIEKVLAEMRRVSAKNVIVDFANKKRPLIKRVIEPSTSSFTRKEFLNLCHQAFQITSTLLTSPLTS